MSGSERMSEGRRVCLILNSPVLSVISKKSQGPEDKNELLL